MTPTTMLACGAALRGGPARDQQQRARHLPAQVADGDRGQLRHERADTRLREVLHEGAQPFFSCLIKRRSEAVKVRRYAPVHGHCPWSLFEAVRKAVKC